MRMWRSLALHSPLSGTLTFIEKLSELIVSTGYLWPPQEKAYKLSYLFHAATSHAGSKFVVWIFLLTLYFAGLMLTISLEIT